VKGPPKNKGDLFHLGGNRFGDFLDTVADAANNRSTTGIDDAMALVIVKVNAFGLDNRRSLLVQYKAENVVFPIGLHLLISFEESVKPVFHTTYLLFSVFVKSNLCFRRMRGRRVRVDWEKHCASGKSTASPPVPGVYGEDLMDFRIRSHHLLYC
jgi:hypothetical protein